MLPGKCLQWEVMALLFAHDNFDDIAGRCVWKMNQEYAADQHTSGKDQHARCEPVEVPIVLFYNNRKQGGKAEHDRQRTCAKEQHKVKSTRRAAQSQAPG